MSGPRLNLEDCLSFARELAWRVTNAGIGHRGLASNEVGESIRAYYDPQRQRTRDYYSAMTRHFGRSGRHSAVPRRKPDNHSSWRDADKPSKCSTNSGNAVSGLIDDPDSIGNRHFLAVELNTSERLEIQRRQSCKL